MTQFSDLKLDPKVLQAITEAGYTTPTPIQAGAIPPALEGRDVLGIAQTGTGKTASFTLPMITLLGRGRARARMPRSLVLCPTRELAAQVAENFDVYAKHTRLTKALLIGGVSMKDQETLMNRGVDVLIATPGRLLDHFERGNLLLQGVQIMVVDEADRMLDMGFIPDIERIFQLTPFTRQTLFFSATMAPEIERITDTFLHAPERIEVARQATTSETITQKLIEFTPTRKDQTAKQKRELLRAVIRDEGEALKNAIIFCNRKTEVDIVAKSLKAHGLDAAPIHGDLEQAQRMRTLDGFREGTLRFLVASDVAARGLDIPAVSHVFNFDLPSHAEDYVHRIGRTGRAGRQGTAISLAVPADEKYLAAIENLVKQTLPRSPAPEGFALSEAASEAPRPAREDGKGRGSRTRSRNGRREDEHRAEPAPREERRPEPQAEERAPERAERREDRRDDRRDERKDERRSETRSEDRRSEPRREDRREERKDDRREGRRDERRDERRDDRREERRGNGGGVMGLGDHVPDFMNRSFRTVAAGGAPMTDTEPKAEAKAEPKAEKPARDSGEGRTRSRRGRGRGRDRAQADDVPATLTGPETALPDAAPALEAVALPDLEVTPAEIAEATVDVTEAEAPASTAMGGLAATEADSGTGATEADAPAATMTATEDMPASTGEAVTEADAPASTAMAEEDAPKPKRTRTRKPKAEAATDADTAEQPKPKRSRKKAAKAEDAAPADTASGTDAASEAEAPASTAMPAEDAPKPKRTRARKPKAKADAGAADGAEAPTEAPTEAGPADAEA